MQKGKHCVTNTFIKAIRKEKLSSNIKIRNPSKISSPKYIKVTESHKIAISIDNIVKKLANTHELWTEPTERTVKFLVNTYSYKKHLLLSGLKLLRDKRNISIFLFLIGKI